jgi:hypothetical protein
MARPTYEVSSVHLTAFVDAAKAINAWTTAEPLLTDAARTALAAANEQRWLPGALLQQISAAIVKANGPETLDALNYRMTKESLSRVFLPFIKVALAITGKTPATIFARLNELSRIATRGVDITWTPEGTNAGVLRVTYPEPPVQVVHVGWRGVFRFAFELTEREGTMDRVHYEGSTAVMRMTWK